MATKDWNGFKKSGDTYIPNDATARAGLQNKVDKVTGKGLSTNDYDNTAKAVVTTAQDNIKANTKLIKDTVGWSGKQKIPYPYADGTSKTANGVTVTVNPDKSFDVKIPSSATGNTYFYVNTSGLVDGIEVGEEYKICGHSDTSYITFVYCDKVSGSSAWGNNKESVNDVLTFIPRENLTDVGLWLLVHTGATGNHTIKPVIVDGDILDTSYEPYNKDTAFPRSEQAVLGAKQLFKPNPFTVNGIAVSVNADDSLNASGTPEQTTTSVRIFNPSVLLKKGTYRATLISGTNLPSDAILRIATVIGGNWSTIATSAIGEDAVFTLNDDITPLGLSIGMNVTSGTAISMSNIKVLITLASDTDRTFAPHAMTNKELTDAVQGIINAALNAADFAAFKTAIGNL